MGRERREVRLVKALNEAFDRKLVILKEQADEEGPFVDLKPQERIQRFLNPAMRQEDEMALLLTKGEQGVVKYRQEMLRLLEERQKRRAGV